MADALAAAAKLRFLDGGGEMGARIRAHDWQATPLGAPETWPQGLRTAVRTALTTHQPMVLFWGRPLTCLYNDGYRASLSRDVHPAALGCAGRKAFAAVWSAFGARIEQVLRGEGAVRHENHRLPALRDGRLEDSYWTYSFGPIDEQSAANGIGGVLVVCAETTQVVLNERRQQFRRTLDERLRSLADAGEIIAAATTALGEHLGVERVGYGEVQPDDCTVRMIHCHADGLPPLTGDYMLDFLSADAVARQRRGEVEFCADVAADASQDREAWAAIDTRAFVSVALIRDGRFRASLYVNSRAPRRWTPQDVALIEEVAARTWTAAERARAERERARGEELRAAQTEVLELAIRDVPLKEALDALVRTVERLSPAGVLASVLLLSEDGTRLLHGAAPSLPDAYNAAIDGIAIGPGVGSCGTAAHRGTPVYVADIATDPLWAEFRDLALAHRLAACWSTPILAAGGEVLGTFAMYHGEPGEPAAADLELVDFVVRSAALLIERKSAEARLRRSEARRGAALAIARLGTFEWEPASGAAVLDERSRAIFGFAAADDLSAAEIFGRMHPEDMPRVRAASIAAAAAGEHLETDYRIVLPGGGMRTVSSLCEPAAGADGRTERMIGVFADVTEQVLADQRLRDSEARYRTLFEAVDVGFSVIELKFDDAGRAIDYRHVEVNPAFARQTGVSGHDTRWVSEGLPGLERHWFDTYGEVARTGRAVRFESFAAPLDRWFDVHAFRPGATEDRRIAVLFNDITERKHAEARLHELNDTLEAQVADRTAELRFHRDVIEATASPICAFDTGLRLTAFNKAHSEEFARIFGHRVRIGEVFPDLFPPDQAPAIRGFMERALTGESFTIITEFGDPGLARPFWEVSYTPLRDESGQVVGAFHLASDITIRRRAEAELRDAQEALRQSQKMEAMGQLTGGVAHDFNNLLTPIVGGLDMLQRRGVGNEREQRLIAGAVASADRAKTLVQRLLAFARRQPLQPVAVDVAALVGGMAGLIGSTLGPTIDIRVALADDLPPASADPNQLEMAILNLGVNARDAMPEGGVLTIAAAAARLPAGHASQLAPGDYVRLSVSDTGTGMDEATRRRAIEPFFSTKGIGKGTGLGLSMVHGLAAQLGGGLTIASKPGVGTTIDLWLPVGSAPSADRAAAARPAPATRQRGRALVVDDEALVRMSTADMLADLGFDVVEAGSGEEALRLLADAAPPDLLVTDHLMPGINGATLARAARSLHPGLPILIVSGYAEADGIAPDLPRLAKPFRNAELAERVAELISAAPSA